MGATFNVVSQKILDQVISYFTTKVAPVIKWHEASDIKFVKGVFYPTARLIVPERGKIYRAEMFLDGALFATSTYGQFGHDYPEIEFVSKLDTNILQSGSDHILSVKAYDFAGNMAVSLPLAITIDNDALKIPIVGTSSPVSVPVNAQPPDTTPPVISNIIIVETGIFNVKVTWETDEPASSELEIISGLCNRESCWNPPPFLGARIRHAHHRDGLDHSTTYSFRVKSRDAAGNLAISPVLTFTTSSNWGVSGNSALSASPRKFIRLLARGSRGDEVRVLQEFLKNLSDIYPEGLVTGYFGPFTEAAVQRFQAFYGIVFLGNPATTGYGLVGPRTRAKLNELLSH